MNTQNTLKKHLIKIIHTLRKDANLSDDAKLSLGFK